MAHTNIKIGANSSEFQKQMKAVNAQLKLTSSECAVASQKAKLFGTATDKLAASQKELTAKIQAQTQIQKLYKDRISDINNQIEKQKGKQKDLSLEIEKVTKKHKDSVEATGKNSKESKALQSELNKLKEEYTRNEKAIESNNKKLVDSTVKLNNNEKNLLQNKKALEQVNKEYESTTKTINKFGDKVQSASKKAQDLGKKASIASVGIAAIGTGSILAYKEVDVGMDNIVKATGATGDAAKGLEKTYKEVASNFNKDFGEMGSTIGEVNTRFGFLDGKLEECTNKFLKFSEINGIDATQAVQLVSRAMGDAGIESDKYSSLLDDLTVAAQASGINIGKLTELLTKYGAPMRALGLDTKESIAIFSSWEKAGVNTEIAFSGMKAAIGKWGKEGKDAAKEFDKTLKKIGEAPSIAKATSMAIETFGIKAGPDLADAIQGGRFEYSEFLKILEGSGGVVDNTFSQVQDGADKAAIAKKSLQVASSELGASILEVSAPALEVLAECVKGVSKWFSGLSSGTKNTIVIIGMLIAAIGPVLLILGTLGLAINSTVSGYKNMVKIGSKVTELFKKLGGHILSCVKAIGKFVFNIGKSALGLVKQGINLAISTIKLIAHKAATVAVTVATKGMALAQKGLNLVMSMNPITLIITLLVALAGIFVLLYNKCEWFRDGVHAVWEGIKNVFTKFSDFLKGIFTTDWTGSFGAIGNILNAFFANISNMFESVKRIFSGIIDFVVGIFTGDWERAWEGVKNVFGGIMDGLGAVMKAPLNAVIGLINMAIDGINSISFTTPDWVPFVGGKHFGVNLPKINYLWKGGIIDSPTFLNNNTVVGDNYKGSGRQAEAVIPLDRMYSNLRKIVKEEQGNGNIYVQLDVKNEFDVKNISKAITTKIKKEITRETNNFKRGKGGVSFAK